MQQATGPVLFLVDEDREALRELQRALERGLSAAADPRSESPPPSVKAPARSSRHIATWRNSQSRGSPSPRARFWWEAAVNCTEFVLSATGLTPVPFVDEISLYLAADIYETWHGTELQAGQSELAPPFWAFAWPGGQALARYVLDHPALVSGRSVLDVGCGSGLVAIAAAKAGASAVTASDTDPFARTAARLNALANQVTVSLVPDVLNSTHEADVVLAGDVWYERDLSDLVMTFLDRAAAAGSEVLAGDIGRRYFPRHRFHPAASYEVPVSRALESTEIMRASVWIRQPDDRKSRHEL